MQEEQIVETPTTPDPEAMWDAGDWAIDSTELEEWFQVPDGQDFKRKVESGEWSKEHANEILSYMKERRSTYREAQDSMGWRGMPRRVAEDVGSAFGETQRLARDWKRVYQDPWALMMSKVGYQNDREGFMAALENVEGAFSGKLAEITGSKEFAAGALMAWEIPKSFVIGVPTSLWSLITGKGDAGDILDVTTFVLPAVKAIRSNVAMMKMARGAAIISAAGKNPLKTHVQQQVREAVADAIKKNKRNVSIPKKLLKDMLNDPEYGPLLQAKYRQLQRAGQISRNIEFGLEAFNLFVQNEELLLELLGYTGQKITLNALTFTKRGMSMEQALDLAVREFAEEYEQAPDWTPEDTTPPTDDADAAADADVAPEEEVAPDADVAPEEEVVEEPEAEAATISAEFTEMVERIAADPEIQAAASFEAQAALIDERMKQYQSEIEAIPEYAQDDIFMNLFGNEIERRIAEIKGETDVDAEADAETEQAADETAEPEEDAAAAEDVEPDAEPAEAAADAEPRERLNLTQAQEQYQREFSQEQVEAVEEPERVSVDVAATSEGGSHFNVYQDFKNVGGAVRSGDRTLYFANEPMRSEKEAQDASTSDAVYRTTKHLWSETEEGEAYYPTFDSLSEMLNYADAQTEARLGGDLHGTPDRLVYDSSRKGRYHVRYELVNINEVQGSHNVDGTENELYPQHLQPHDQRGSDVDIDFLDEKARDVAPEILVDHFAQLTDGAPALSKEFPDASVSGSGRLWILKKMLQDYPDQWQKYRDYLRKNARQYGKSEADVDADPESILVRRIVDEVDEVELAKDANKFAGLEDTSAEQANRDASYLKDSVMVEWKGMRGMSFAEALNDSENAIFRQKLLQNIPARQRTGFLSSDGESISDRGAQRIRAMMLRYVFRGEYGLKMSEILIESKFDELQNINNMLEVLIPQLALLESYFRTNRRDSKYSIAEEMARAVGTLNQLKLNGDRVGDFFKQDMLFQPKTQIGELNVPTLQMLYIMDHRIGAYQQLATIFLRYVNSVLELDPAQGGFLELDFTKETFFQKEMFDILWAHPPEDLKKQLEGGEVSQARNITQAYVENLMSEIRRQAEQRAEEPTPPEPEPEAEQAAADEAVADEEVVEEPEAEAEVVEEQTADEQTAEEETQDAAPEEQDAALEEDVEETVEPELEITEAEFDTADRHYRHNISTLAKQYFRAILADDFAGEAKLPQKVEFAEKYTLERNLPPDTIALLNDLVEAQKLIDRYLRPNHPRDAAWEAEIRKNVLGDFGAHVLQAYDYAVSEKARNDIHTSTPELIFYRPKTGDTPAERTYVAGKNSDIFISVVHHAEEGKATVTFDIPDYEKVSAHAEIYGRFTDKQARAAIDQLLYRGSKSVEFVYGDNPRTYASPLTETQQRRIEKMPPIVEEVAFKDKNSNTKEGVAYAIPGLDPAMRLKASFVGDNQYAIYMESELVQNSEGFTVTVMPAESPLDAVQRFLADYFEDATWDALNEDPDPVADPLDAQGVAGNMPAPLPTEIHLTPMEATDNLIWFAIGDSAGNTLTDYSVTVDPDPLGLNDGTMEVTVRFPNHKQLDAVMELAQGDTPEQAVMAAISNLLQYKIGKGGLGATSGEPYESTNDALLENLPPPVKSTEKDFGTLRIDSAAMAREGYSKSGKTQIYMFDGTKDAPQATVRRLDTDGEPLWNVELRYPRYNAVAGVSYAKTAKAAIKEVLDHFEKNDHRWKPLYKGGIYTEMDAVQNALNRRLFATTPAIERRVRGVFTNLRKGVAIDLRGYTITSHKELAVLGQLFRHPGLERFVEFYLDENHNILGHEVVSFGVPGQTVNMSYSRVNYNMRRLKAKYFINMHNHPGGPATFSQGDKDAAGAFLKQYGDSYLGQIVVNSLEYAESKPYADKHGNWKMRNRDNIELTEAELGWKPGQQKGFFRRNTRIRPGDPLYQYDVNSETGKLLKLVGESPGGTLKNAAKFAKYLQTEKNWTTIFFKGHHGEILDVAEYKDLHLLPAAELWNFLEGQSRSRGAMYIDTFIGEGDWYETAADVRNSSWHEILRMEFRHPRGSGGNLEGGIQFAWFDGLKDPRDKTVTSVHAKTIMPLYESEAASFIAGRVHETTIDTDYGIDHSLATPSPERAAFIQDLLEAIQDGEPINEHISYYHHFGTRSNLHSMRFTQLLEHFTRFVSNQFIRSEDINPNIANPTDAVGTYTEMLVNSQTTDNAKAYLQTRLAAITEKDRVLTIGDNSGHLATFAKLAGAASVETTNTDGFVRDMFHQILPNVADAVHAIDPDNLAREWTGPRPTVILLYVWEDYAQKLDEALKILAPNGRLVVVAPEFQSEMMVMGKQRQSNYWQTLTTRNHTERLLIGSNYVTVMDKRKGQGMPSLTTAADVDTLFANIEEIRHARHPIAEGDPNAEFTGVGPSEQTFTQPISNPNLPGGLRLAGTESLSLPPTDRGGTGEGEGSPSPTALSRPGSDVRVANAQRGGAAPTQTDALSGMSATPATPPVGSGGPGIETIGTQGAQRGADVDTHMEAESAYGQMPLQEGQVSTSPRSPRTRATRGRAPFEDGTLFSLSGIGGYQTGRVQRDTELGIPAVRTVEADADTPPDDTPTKADMRTRINPYTMLVQTGKRTLELMGDTGMSLVSSLKRIRNFGDRLSGRGFVVLDTLFPEWKKYVRAYAKEKGIKLDEASKELNQILVQHHEGNSMGEVPDIVDKIVKEVRGFFHENLVTPILEENKNILRQGYLFEMPSQFVEDGYLTEEHRAAIDMDRPEFDKFMRRSGQQARTKGIIQGFVQDKETDKVYAVFVQSKSYYKKTKNEETGEITGETVVIPGSETYTLENPFGDKIKLEENPLLGDTAQYTLLTYRDPKRQRWTKGRDVAKHLWNTEISNGLPDPIRDAFEAEGIAFPTGAKFIYSKKANIEEWQVRVNGSEIYRIRRIVPVAEKVVETPFGSFTDYSQPHPAYDAFLNKLMVYKASEVRNPIFTFRKNTPHKIWTPLENYFPHIIDWNTMSLDPRDKTKFEKFVEYAQEVADANGVDVDLAKVMLSHQIAEAKTRRYGHLEQDRQFIFPNYKRNYFQVWEQYITRAAHRMQTIKEFGQMNDLLEAKLTEFLSSDAAVGEMDAVERAVVKLRFFAGYRDFEKGGRGPQYPFRNDEGAPIEISPHDIDFSAMSPAEWQALVDADILTVTDEGNYKANAEAGGLLFLENPTFLNGVLAKGAEQMKIAADIIIGQLGWSQGDIFDSIFSDSVRQIRNWTGFVYLGRAWASNIVQPVNAAILTGPRAVIKSYLQLMLNSKHKEYAKEVGAVAIDVMHDYGGEAQFGNRLLRQMLGATPHYQVGKLNLKSLSPFKKSLENDGIRTMAWTPFFAVERSNRTVSALMARSYAAQQMRTMLKHPKRANTAKERLLAQPGAYDLEAKLTAALSVPNLTPKDIDVVQSLTEKEVREQAPHLFPVYDFFAEYAKEMADYTQHRVESMDRSKLLRDDPLMLMLMQLQSFNLAQTKYIKDTFKREFRIMHEFLKERQPLNALKNKNVARVLGSLYLIPRMLTWSGIYGIQGVLLGALARTRVPSEDELNFVTAVYKAGMFTMIGEQMRQIWMWNRGAEEVLLGPSLGIGADVLGDVFMAAKKGEVGRAFRTPARLARPPLAGPSVQQLIQWAGEGDKMPPKRVNRGRGRRAMPQRRQLQQRQLR